MSKTARAPRPPHSPIALSSRAMVEARALAAISLGQRDRLPRILMELDGPLGRELAPGCPRAASELIEEQSRGPFRWVASAPERLMGLARPSWLFTLVSMEAAWAMEPIWSALSPDAREARGGFNLNALGYACARGQADCVRELLRLSAGTEQCLRAWDGGARAMVEAAGASSIPCAELLIAAGESPSAHATMVEPMGGAIASCSALHWAGQAQALAMVEWLLARGAQIDARSGSRLEPLLQFAARSGNPRLTRLLLERGASLGARDAAGNEPGEFAPTLPEHEGRARCVALIKAWRERGALAGQIHSAGGSPARSLRI